MIAWFKSFFRRKNPTVETSMDWETINYSASYDVLSICRNLILNCKDENGRKYLKFNGEKVVVNQISKSAKFLEKVYKKLCEVHIEAHGKANINTWTK